MQTAFLTAVETQCGIIIIVYYYDNNNTIIIIIIIIILVYSKSSRLLQTSGSICTQCKQQQQQRIIIALSRPGSARVPLSQTRGEKVQSEKKISFVGDFVVTQRIFSQFPTKDKECATFHPKNAPATVGVKMQN